MEPPTFGGIFFLFFLPLIVYHVNLYQFNINVEFGSQNLPVILVKFNPVDLLNKLLFISFWAVQKKRFLKLPYPGFFHCLILAV